VALQADYYSLSYRFPDLLLQNDQEQTADVPQRLARLGTVGLDISAMEDMNNFGCSG